ncbi:protein FAM163B [Sorex araneus]|uniref:protein FAM163B n=1 Tax=Sorex araneus TaxID=42254 RepID=UPI0003315A20|nr:protein FAM163B [Sorex araneus]
MTAGTVVITGGILATVILLCIIAVLCYCRLQYYCCKREEPEDEEEEPDFAVHAPLPPPHPGRHLLLANGPLQAGALRPASPPARALCRSCSYYEPPSLCLQEPDEDPRNGGGRVGCRSLGQEGGLQALDPGRLAALREAFSRSRSVSTDV